MYLKPSCDITVQKETDMGHLSFFFFFFLIPPSFNKWLVLRQFEVKRLEDNQKCLVSIHSTFLLSRSCLCPLHTKYQITPKQARSACLCQCFASVRTAFVHCWNALLTSALTPSGTNCLLVASEHALRSKMADEVKMLSRVDLLNKSVECSVVLSDRCISSRC